MNYTKTTFILTSIFGLISIFQSKSFASNDSLLAPKVKICSLKSQDADRLKCFDSIAQTLEQVTLETQDKPDAMAESLGGSKFDKVKRKPKSSGGQVSSCKKSYDGKWFFIFDNGQVWKQIKAARANERYRDCDFSASIYKDGFGYKMKIKSLSKEFRVKRHR